MVQVLTGPRFARAIRAGALAVVREQETLNRINVFPVPDADTGANLASTLRSAAAALSTRVGLTVGQTARTAADAALDGARGNSGAIFAQFLYGIAEATGSRVHLTTREFAAAVRRGADAAQQALSQPVEGTILSVIREWAASLEEHAPRIHDFRELMVTPLVKAREAVANTPRQLAVLAKHNVVDAGALGFVFFLEGIQRFFADRAAADWRRAGLSVAQPTPFAAAHAELDDTYRYCTEGLLSGDRLDRKVLARAVAGLGGSVVVAGGGSRVRVHIHTNEPQRVFGVLAGLATIETTKIDDMIVQQMAARTARVAVATDSASDLSESTIHAIHLIRVPLSVAFGDSSFQDGVDITPPLFYRLLETRPELPRTSQPAIGDFKSTFSRLLESREGVVYVSLSSGMSGTYQAAMTAAQQVDPLRIRVVDSRHNCGAQGLVAEVAGRAAAEGRGLDEVEALARAAVDDVTLFTVIGSLDMGVRGGRIPRGAARVAKLLRLYPIITIGPDGKARPCGFAVGFAAAMRSLARRVRRFSGPDPAALIVSHANAVGAAEYLAEHLTRLFGISDIPIVDAAIALAAHVGPGSVAVSVRRAARR
ncbi:MAG: DegV family EDD domain-containing protein [Thermoanaerobaculaceae bacterium]|jgi:hypothetical protein|nr:DegV family EDD domain-containing protein [Thermoanaerobaculaceae bacterium]